MIRLKDEAYNLTRRGAAPGRVSRVRLILPFLIFASVGLLVLSRINHSAIAEMRARMSAGLSPALEALATPLAPLRQFGRRMASQINMTEELQQLRADNQKLNSWEWRARELERKLADLERLARVAPEARVDFVTSRVIADSSGAFRRSVLIDSGTSQNVRAGYPVINADGLVGRVVEAGPATARVLLSTDLNSRIPVVIGDAGVRAILAGDNGPAPRLIYIPQDAKISIGDDVATSGAGGLFPRGLRIGKVIGDIGNPRVAPRAKLDQLEYLSVLFVDDAAPPARAGSGDPKRAGEPSLAPDVAAARGAR